MIAFALAADFKGSGSWGRMDFFLFVTITSWLLVIARFVVSALNLILKLAINVNFGGNLSVRASYYEKNYMVEYSDLLVITHLPAFLVLSS